MIVSEVGRTTSGSASCDAVCSYLPIVTRSIENGSPRLFVGNLNVLAQRYFFAPGAASNAPREGGLDVSFDLYGYLPPSVEVSRAR